MQTRTMIFHRLADLNEMTKVRRSGELWGKARAVAFGNGPASVKAYVGPLPNGARGYAFETETPPTRFGMHLGMRKAEWVEGSPGVLSVAGQNDYVKIEVEMLDV